MERRYTDAEEGEGGLEERNDSTKAGVGEYIVFAVVDTCLLLISA